MQNQTIECMLRYYEISDMECKIGPSGKMQRKDPEVGCTQRREKIAGILLSVVMN